MKIRVLKTNRRVRLSPHIIAAKELDGKRGYLVMTHYTNIDDILQDEKPYRVSPGENIKVAAEVSHHANIDEWTHIADVLNRPGFFDKLYRYFK